MDDYKRELKKYFKEEFKRGKKNGIKYSNNIKDICDLLTNNLTGRKLEIVYKYRYFIFNNGINKLELEKIYKSLFKKILFLREDSIVLNDGYNNVFHNIFANLPSVYNKHGIEFINIIVNLFCCTKNEDKLMTLTILFSNSYNIEKIEKEYLNKLINCINKTEKGYLLKSYETLCQNLSSMCDNITIKVDKIEYIFEMFSKSKSEYNSKKLIELLEIFEENIINNLKLYELFEIASTSDSKDLVDSIVELVDNNNFRHLDDKIQNRCIDILKGIENIKFLNLRLTTKIIIDIVLTAEKEIQNFLLSKLETIKNPESLQLILALTPLLNEFIDNQEYVRVIDSLEDKDNNITKKLIINLNN